MSGHSRDGFSSRSHNANSTSHQQTVSLLSSSKGGGAASTTHHDGSSSSGIMIINRKDSFNKKNNYFKTPTRKMSIKGQRWMCILVVFVIVAVVTVTNYPDAIESYTNKNGLVEAKIIDDIVTIPLKPQISNIEGIDHYYMFPPPPSSSSSSHLDHNNNNQNENGVGGGNGQQENNNNNNNNSSIRGVLIFLHSCKKSGLDFFHLPEDRIIAYDAIYNHRLVVLAPTSKHRDSGCYTSEDIDWIDKIVDEWTVRHHVEHLPRMGMAVSSSASFIFFVHKSLKLQSLAVYNTPQSFLFHDINESHQTKGAVIPTVFITMPSDTTIASQMEYNYEQLLETNTVATQLYKITSHPFTSNLCLTRLPEIKPSDCEKMFDILKNEFSNLIIIDNNNNNIEGGGGGGNGGGGGYYYVKEPLDLDQWQSYFAYIDQEFTIDSTTTTANQYYMTPTAYSGYSWLYTILQQEMRASQAYHSISADHHTLILNFLMDHAGIG